jgi:competence protein ComEA
VGVDNVIHPEQMITRERIILIVAVTVLAIVYAVGFYQHARWQRQYALVVEELTMKISINDASQGELQSLPGIGPAIADKIIEYRDRNGGFSTLEALKKVKGIGEKKYEKILPFITL